MFSKEKAEELFKVSGCDAIMVARGAIGSPWIFAELLGQEFTGSKFDVMKEHYSLLEKSVGDRAAVMMRKHFAAYFKGMKNASKYKCAINSLTKKEEIFALLSEMEKDNEED